MPTGRGALTRWSERFLEEEVAPNTSRSIYTVLCETPFPVCVASTGGCDVCVDSSPHGYATQSPHRTEFSDYEWDVLSTGTR